jgi:hypothetical protein
MPVSHLYPDPSDLCPFFLSGQLDLDDQDTVSSLALGEAILSVQGNTRPLPFAVLAHAYSGLPDRNGSRFMFGLLPEKPVQHLPEDSFLNLHAAELA